MPFNQFTVTGTDQTDSVEIRTNPAYAQVDLKRSVAIAAPTRGEDNTIHIELGPNDMVELVYDDSTTWVCSHEGLEELFPGQLAPQQQGADNTVRLPLTLQRPGAERGSSGISP
ncbi:hypothetical protein ACQ86N_01495 [Puia sp. P3]|uniref:hypothetical protein n=1 Tax=Puia sp. P3 TaxID=3423952 RepID=UPI003D66D929